MKQYMKQFTIVITQSIRNLIKMLVYMCNVLKCLYSRYTLRLDPDHIVQQKIAAVLKTQNGILMYCTRRQSDQH